VAERATIAQTCQIGLETTPGTAVAAGKRLGSIGFTLAPTIETNPQRPMGQKYANLQILGKEWTTAAVEGAPVYTELPYLLSSVMSTATSVAQIMDGGTPTGAYTWIFDSNAFGDDSPKTYTVEQGSSVRAARAAGLILSDLTINFDRSEVTLEGEAYGKALEDGITMTASPTQLPQVPVRPTEVSVYADTTAAGLGTTKLVRALGGSFKLASRFSPLWVVDAAQASYVASVETEPDLEMTLMQVADSEGMANLTSLRAGTTRFFRIEAVGPTIYATTNVKHRLRIDVAAQVKDVSEPSDEDGVYAIEWTLGGVVDPTWAKALRVELITTTSAL
jgi:hypothetical protein